MPEPLQGPQTAEPVQANTPSIVTNLDTNTGPEATPNAFGPNLEGLAQGLDSANQDIQQTIYRNRYEIRQQQQAANQVAATNAVNNADMKWTSLQMNARAKGTTLDPDELAQGIENDRADAIAKAANPEQASMINMGYANLKLGQYKQAMAFQVETNQRNRVAQAKNFYDTQVQSANAGTRSDVDAIANIAGYNDATQAAVPGGPDMASAAKTQVIQGSIARMANTQGPRVAAVAIRGGLGGTVFSDLQREDLATSFDNRDVIQLKANASAAQKTVDLLTQQAASGQTVSEATMADAQNKLTEATRALPVDQGSARPNVTGAPSIVDVVQKTFDKIGDLRDQIAATNTTDPDGAVAAVQKITIGSVNRFVEQRLNTMPLDQQQTEVDKMGAAFGEDNPVMAHARALLDLNTHLLTKGDPRYAPAVATMRDPFVATTMSNAMNAVQAAGNDPVKLGAAQGQMKIALGIVAANEQLLGVAPEDVQYLTPDQRNSFRAQATQPPPPSAPGAPPPKNPALMVSDQVDQMYGDAAPQVMQEIWGGKDGAVSGATQMMFMNRQSAALAQASMYKPDWNEDEKKKMSAAVDGNSSWVAYQAANSNNVYFPAKAQDLRAGLMQVAAWYQHNGTPDLSQAVQKAFDESMGHRFTVAPSGPSGTTLAAPKEVFPTADDATSTMAKGRQVASWLNSTGVNFKGQDGALDPATRNLIASGRGSWVYEKNNGDPKNAAITLTYPSSSGAMVPVLLPDGRPFSLNAAALKSATNYVVPRAPGAKVFVTPDMVAHPHFPLNVDLNALLPPPPNRPGVNPPIPPPPPPKPPNPVSVPTTPMAPQASNTGVTGFETTHFGYHDDPDVYGPNGEIKDHYTAAGEGKWGLLHPGAVALTDTMAAKLGAKPHDMIEMVDKSGKVRRGVYVDRAPESNDRIDIYDPEGSEQAGTPFVASSARVLTSSFAAQ